MPAKIIQELKEKIEFYERVLDNIRNGVMITDPQGKIIFFSTTYGNFLGVDPQEVMGKQCSQVVENTRMDVVARTGIPEINHPHRIKGQDMVVQRIPIEKDGRVIAVYGQVMFEDIRDVQSLAKKLNFLESKVELYEKELTTLRSSKYTFNHIMGKSPAIGELKKDRPEGGQDQRPGADHGRKRYGQGIVRPCHSLCQQPPALPLCPFELCRHSPGPVGGRVVRLPAGGLHRGRQPGKTGQV